MNQLDRLFELHSRLAGTMERAIEGYARDDLAVVVIAAQHPRRAELAGGFDGCTVVADPSGACVIAGSRETVARGLQRDSAAFVRKPRAAGTVAIVTYTSGRSVISVAVEPVRALGEA